MALDTDCTARDEPAFIDAPPPPPEQSNRTSHPGAHDQNTFGPTEGQNVQGREANRHRQRQTNEHHGLVPPLPPPNLGIRIPLALCCISHVSGGERLKTSWSWEVKRAGPSVGGTPRGSSSFCEQRDNCPTLTFQKHFSPVAWDK